MGMMPFCLAMVVCVCVAVYVLQRVIKSVCGV